MLGHEFEQMLPHLADFGPTGYLDTGPYLETSAAPPLKNRAQIKLVPEHRPAIFSKLSHVHVADFW